MTPVRAIARPNAQLTPPRLLAVAQDLYGNGPVSYVFSIRGEHFDYGEQFSPALKIRVPELLERVNKLIAQPEAAHTGPKCRATVATPMKSAE